MIYQENSILPHFFNQGAHTHTHTHKPTKQFIVPFGIKSEMLQHRRKQLIVRGRGLKGDSQSRLHTRSDI